MIPLGEVARVLKQGADAISTAEQRYRQKALCLKCIDITLIDQPIVIYGIKFNDVLYRLASDLGDLQRIAIKVLNVDCAANIERPVLAVTSV